MNWPNWILIIILLAVGCASPGSGWVKVDSIDDGSFSVEMPRSSGGQHGELVLGLDTFATHINILADSGITYVASWMKLPASYKEIGQEPVLDSLWASILKNVNGSAIGESGPSNSLAGSRAAWLVIDDEVRMGLIMGKVDDRVIILNAATPNHRYGAMEERNMARFFNSYARK